MLLLVFGIALAIRLIALVNLEIITPDGVLYVYQAKAIATGQWHLLNQCGLPYISIYPLLIALFHLVVSNWILSAQLVSLFFGLGMLVMLYPLLRQYFNPTISQLTVLIFALIPVFVRHNVDVVRESIFWFFYTSSILMFVLHTRQKGCSRISLGLLFASSCLILLAAWSRIEGLILLPVSCLCIIIAHGDRRPLRLLVFLLPWICLAGAVWLGISHRGSDVLSLIRLDEVGRKFYEPVASYHSLRAELKMLASLHSNSLMGFFLETSYHTVWLIAVVAIINNAMESFFYPYVPFFIVGAIVVYKQLNRQSAFLYPVLIILFSFLLLYAHTLQLWIMTYRFITLAIIPACVLAGLGMEKILHYLIRILKIEEKIAVAVVVVFIVVAALFKNTSPIESDKAVYAEIGHRIEQLANGNFPVGVAGKPSVVHSWISFYANVESKNPVCHQQFTVDPSSIVHLKSLMHSRGVSYFLWQESSWKNAPFGRNDADFLNEFVELGRWHHQDTGELILFRL